MAEVVRVCPVPAVTGRGCHCSWPKTCRLSYVGGAPSSRYMRCLATGPLPRPDGRVAPRARVLPRSRSPAPPQLENRFPRLLTHAWSNASAPVGVCGIGVNEVHCRQPPTRSTVETPGARPAASKLPAEGFPSADVVLDVGRDSATSIFGSPIRTALLRGLRPGSRLHHHLARLCAPLDHGGHERGHLLLRRRLGGPRGTGPRAPSNSAPSRVSNALGTRTVQRPSGTRRGPGPVTVVAAWHGGDPGRVGRSGAPAALLEVR